MRTKTLEFTGTTTLIRFALRRDRVRILVWIAAVVALVVVTAASVKDLYPTQHDLDVAAKTVADNAAAIAFNGPVQALDTVGGQVAFQGGAIGLVVVGLMSLLMTGRLTRGEEEAGRLEMLRSLPVGSQAPTAAATVTVVGMDVVVGAAIALALVALGLPVAGSIVFGASFTVLGVVFVGVALVAAQISENTRVVYGSAGIVLGAAFALRAIGDIGDGAVSWLSPIGWAQKTRPFAGEEWWPFLVILAVVIALAVTVHTLSARRDVGAGMVQPRPGPADATPALGRPLGLAVRLQRGSLIGWAAGVLLFAFVYGALVHSIKDFIADNQSLADFLAKVGGARTSLTDAYLATTFRTLALIATGFVVQSVLRVRGEETAGRAEPVLATPVSRTRWAAGHLVVALIGTVLVLVGSGLAVGVTYGVTGGGIHVVPGLVGASVVYFPAMGVMLGVSALLVGVAPRATALAWAYAALCFVIGFLGELLKVPQWLADVSPFAHIPQLPAHGVSVLPLVVITAVAAAFTAVGLVGLRRRDVGAVG